MKIPRRSLVTGAAGAAMFAAMGEQADADIAFTSFAFKATGGNTALTMPNRLAQIINVMDFGADPTGGTHSDAAVQAAVDSVSGANRGVIYFPHGFYVFGAAVTFNYNGPLGISFVGDAGTAIVGSFAGFLFDRHNVNSGSPLYTNGGMICFEKLNIQQGNNSPSAGCVRIGSTIGASFRDCQFQGQTCVTAEDSPGNSSQNILFENCTFTGPNSAPYIADGIVIGGTGAIVECDFVSSNHGVRAYGNGLYIVGSRAENVNCGYMFGLDTGVAATFTGSIAHTGTNDGSGILTVSAIASGTIKPLQELSDGGVNIQAAIVIISQLSGTTGGTGTYSVTNPTFTLSSQTITSIGNDRGASGFYLSSSLEGNKVGISLAGTCSGFSIGSFQEGHDVGNSGYPVTVIASQYGLIVGPNCSSGFIQFGYGNFCLAAAIYIATQSARANLLFVSSAPVAGSGGVDWVLPTNAYTAFFLNCGNLPNSNIWTFSQLPTVGGGNDQEGDEFNISDSNVNGWSNNVTSGGGTDRVLVRNNGTHYTVVGI